MRRDRTKALLGVLSMNAAAMALLLVAWLPGVGPAGLPSALTTTSPDRSLPLVLALAMAGFVLWLTVTVLVALAAEAPGAAGSWAAATLRRLAPAAVRRALAVTLGLTVLTSTAGVAQAAAPTGHVTVSQATSSPALSLDWPAAPARTPAINLDRPAPVVHHDPPRKAAKVPVAQAIPPQTVTVRPGDSLWRIAARALPRGTASAVIERSWHRWYAANRTVIGPDPGLIQPGQQLTPPAT